MARTCGGVICSRGLKGLGSRQPGDEMPKAPEDMSEKAVARRAALSAESKILDAKKAVAVAKVAAKPRMAKKR